MLTTAFVVAGDGFMAHYYPDVLTALRLGHADIPHVKDEKKLALEASGWLKNQLLKAAKTVSVAASKLVQGLLQLGQHVVHQMKLYFLGPPNPLRFHQTRM